MFVNNIPDHNHKSMTPTGMSCLANLNRIWPSLPFHFGTMVVRTNAHIPAWISIHVHQTELECDAQQRQVSQHIQRTTQILFQKADKLVVNYIYCPLREAVHCIEDREGPNHSCHYHNIQYGHNLQTISNIKRKTRNNGLFLCLFLHSYIYIPGEINQQQQRANEYTTHKF